MLRQNQIRDKYNLYLDIDGVLLKRDGTIPEFGVPFVSFATQNFRCFWLTTHCRGDENRAISYLSRHYPREVVMQLLTVQPAFWDTLKTEAIDFSQPFYWLEDNPLFSELRILEERQKLERLIHVNLSRKNELKNVKEMLAGKINRK